MAKNSYIIPIEKEKIFVPISDPEARFGANKESVDFMISPDTKILAAAKGEVVDVKVDSKVGGDDEKYAALEYQNFITIKHDNSEYSQYIHLAPNSSLVKKGDFVNQGDIIADGIGMIGYTTAPHVHFMVIEFSDNEVGFNSIKINWDESFKVYGAGPEIQEELKKEKYKLLLNECKEVVKKNG